MTQQDGAMNPSNDVHALSGAYAVDALDDTERVRFEEHLARCAECRAEVDSLRAAAAELSAGAEVAPPPALRDDVLAAIEQVRPLPPLMSPGSPGEPGEPTDLRTRRRTTIARRAPLLLGAAAVVAVLAVGAAWWRPWTSEEPVPTAPTATERVLAADDAVRTRLDVPEGSRATLVVSRSEGRAVILTEAMPPAPEGTDYQLWLETPDEELVSAGLMPDDEDATVLLDGDATEATGFGISVEPDGGSSQPTTVPIVFTDLE